MMISRARIPESRLRRLVRRGGQCLSPMQYSYSAGTISNSYDLVFDGLACRGSSQGDYLHCAVEPLNGHAGATDSYLISDEAAPGTHNEAVYEPGGDAYIFRTDVFLNPWSQTAACSRIAVAGPPAGATVIDNLAATYGSNGALGVQDGSNPSCASPLQATSPSTQPLLLHL